MNTENAALDYGCDWQIVKNLVEVVPDVMVAILLANLVVEPVQESYVPGLVVPSQQYHLVRIFQLI